jgi:hypothetical protein
VRGRPRPSRQRRRSANWSRVMSRPTRAAERSVLGWHRLHAASSFSFPSRSARQASHAASYHAARPMSFDASRWVRNGSTGLVWIRASLRALRLRMVFIDDETPALHRPIEVSGCRRATSSVVTADKVEPTVPIGVHVVRVPSLFPARDLGSFAVCPVGHGHFPSRPQNGFDRACSDRAASRHATACPDSRTIVDGPVRAGRKQQAV